MPTETTISLPASATEAEAAAIAAAIARFQSDHAPVIAETGPLVSPWQRAALMEATGREPDAPSPWGDPVPWGR